MNDKQKILYIVNNAAFFVSHRLPIALAATKRGYLVALLTGQAGSRLMEIKAVQILKGLNVSHHRVRFTSSGINPISELIAFIKLLKKVNEIRPSLIHCISPKGIIYGGIAARILGIRYLVLSVSGMGYAFTRNNSSNWFRLSIAIIYSLMLGFILKHPNLRVIVQNADDQRIILNLGVLDINRVILVPGSGVDLPRFIHFDIEKKLPIILLPTRMLWDKGVWEFLEAAKNLKQLMPKWRFILAGAADYKNPSSVPESLLEKLNKENIIEWLGFVENLEAYYAKASIVCLPSYREGMPKCLLEGAAAGCAIVTTDAIGCRDAILPNVTGFLVSVANSYELTNALRRLMVDKDLREEFGRAGRELAINKYGLEAVIRNNLSIYEDLFNK